MLLLEYQVDRHLLISGSYSIFPAAASSRIPGDHKSIQFVGLEAVYRF